MKQIAILGTGYVGLVTGTCFADFGNKVYCVDIDKDKITLLNQGKSPIYEPGLEELIQKNMSNGSLSFTTESGRAIENSDIVFVCLPTPSADDGHCDTSYIFSAAKVIGEYMNNYKIIVNKSTCPPGTVRKLEAEIKKYTNQKFSVASNPEFLKEGSAVLDFMKPERVVIGTEEQSVAQVLSELYAPVTLNNNPILVVKIESAEEGKYASNALLATKISFINEEAQRCELIGADVREVAKIMGTDSRIGSQFLFAGPGYGGSCFPKDTKAVIADSKNRGIVSTVIEAANSANDNHKIYSAKKIINACNGVAGKTLAVWGVAFKANTDDIREAPALTILSYLLKEGANLRVNDPKAIDNARKVFGTSLIYCDNIYATCNGSDALVVMTDWNNYKDPDFKEIKSRLKEPLIIDLRNLFYRMRNDIKSKGFKYVGMGI